VANLLLEKGLEVLMAAAAKIAPKLSPTLPNTSEVLESTQVTEFRTQHAQLVQEWQDLHTEQFASTYLQLAFAGFRANLEYRNACKPHASGPKVKHIKVHNGKNHRAQRIPLTGLDEWVTRTQDPQHEVRQKAKRNYQLFKQAKAVHWYEVQIARNILTTAAYNAKLDY
jgi:hypothetical protein